MLIMQFTPLTLNGTGMVWETVVKWTYGILVVQYEVILFNMLSCGIGITSYVNGLSSSQDKALTQRPLGGSP